MRDRLMHLQYGKRRAVLFTLAPFVKLRVTVYGVGSTLYSLVETAGITAILFFLLHIGYVILSPWYSPVNVKYGLIGILLTALAVDAAVLLMHWLRIGPSGVSEITAAAWVSLMTALLVLGAAAIVYSEGKLLMLLNSLRPSHLFTGVIVMAAAFVVSLSAIYTHVRSARLI